MEYKYRDITREGQSCSSGSSRFAQLREILQTYTLRLTYFVYAHILLKQITWDLAEEKKVNYVNEG